MASEELSYYYGYEAEQFSFYRIPKLLFTDSRFAGISTDAKLLYGILLDRMSLSMKNGWHDEQGRVYIIFTLDDVAETLDRTTNAQGEILIADLEPGVYSVKETATVADHILDPTEYHVELFPGQTSTITIQNDKRPDLTIRKTDKDTGEPISGVTFRLNYADGPTITTEPTGDDGTVTIENLLPGVYTVTEQSVPEGYILDTPPSR